MDKVINLALPYVGEQVFESLETDTLVQYLDVSEAWKILAENVLLKRWKYRLYEACKTGKSRIVELLLEHYNFEEIGLNVMVKDNYGPDPRNQNVLNCTKYRTPLMAACAYGHIDVVQMLLDHSADSIDLNAMEKETKVVTFVKFHNTKIHHFDKTVMMIAIEEGQTSCQIASKPLRRKY